MKNAHILRPLKGKTPKMRLLFFDIETETIQETDKLLYQRFKLGTANLVNYRPGESFTIIDTYQWYKSEHLQDWLLSNLQQKQVLYVLSANIWFDIRNSGIFIDLVHNGWKIVNFYSKGFTTIIKLRKDTYTIMFLNMQQLIPVSVKKYGEMVGMQKLEIDLQNTDNEKLMTYCQRDTDIITEVFRQWLDFVYSNDLGKFGFTLASQALIAYRHRFMYRKIFIHKNEWLTKLERECYYGGRTEIFRKGKIKEGEIYYLDVNSMYPWAMSQHKMPVKWVKVLKAPQKYKLAWYLQRYICMAWVALDTPEPAYPKRMNGRLCFPTGKFLTYLSHPELKYAYHNNHVVSIYYLTLYEKADIFSDYVAFFHKLKGRYTEEGNEAYRFMTKRILNSLYGKFGQKADILFFEDTISEEQYSQMTVIDPDTGISYKELCLGKTRKVYQEAAGEAYNSFVAIPAHITGLSRMHLYSLMRKAGSENVLYCDTDSLFVNTLGYKNLKSSIVSGQLGMLNLEKTSSEVTINCPKDYIFGNETVIKGVKHNSKQNKLGGYEQLQFPGFRGDLSSGLEKPYAIRKVTKYLTREYKKGLVGRKGFVTPFKLSEF